MMVFLANFSIIPFKTSYNMYLFYSVFFTKRRFVSQHLLGGDESCLLIVVVRTRVYS
jgi:hypothetical protein